MNESDKRELEQLKQRQKSIETQLASLANHIQQLESRIASTDAPVAPEPPLLPPVISPVSEPTPLAIPPIIPAAIEKTATQSQSEPALSIPRIKPGHELAAGFHPSPGAKTTRPSEADVSLPPLISSTPPAPKSSFALQLGTYWLVRIRAVLVLTGLAFFGNLAYQKMGAGGKVSLLYLASGLLLGAGAWWQRKAASESLHNFAQVLFAGGLAAVYFTTYAAHHVPTLQVIGSALLDGLLLFGWAGYIAWVADRRKSELLALLATGLAYCASVITPVGNFTLLSNLVLTITAVVFLVRNR